MPQAKIKINAVVGSNDDLPINSLVNLDNQNLGGEASFLWSIVDQPLGAADALSSTTVQTPSFTPKKEGTYVLKLIVNAGPAQFVDMQIAAVRQLKTRERVPGFQEESEAGSRGWAGAAGSLLQRVDSLAADPGVIVGVAGVGGMTRGKAIVATAAATIKSGLPGQEVVPSFTLASPTLFASVNQLVGVLEGGVDGSTTPALNALIRVRVLGRFGSLSMTAAGSVGAPVFVQNSGSLDWASVGTVPLQVAHIIASNGGGNYDVMVDSAGLPQQVPIATTLQGPAVAVGILGDGVTFTTIPNTSLVFTPGVQRSMLVHACITGQLNVAGVFTYRLRLDSVVIASATFIITAGLVSEVLQLPPIQAVLPAASLPLGPHTLDIQIRPALGTTYTVGILDVISYGIT